MPGRLGRSPPRRRCYACCALSPRTAAAGRNAPLILATVGLALPVLDVDTIFMIYLRDELLTEAICTTNTIARSRPASPNRPDGH
jgi:hypothetical protein